MSPHRSVSRPAERRTPHRATPPGRTTLRRALRTIVVAGVCAALVGCSGVDEGPIGDDPTTGPAGRRPAGGDDPGYDKPTHHDTGDRSELVSVIPVGPTATNAGKRVLFSQRTQLQGGQILLAVAELQVTNDLDRNVFLGSQLVLADSATAVAGAEITPANGENVTPNMHHGQQTKSGTYAATSADAGVRYVNVVAWAAATGAASGDTLTVDAGYGRLSVLQW